MRPQSLSLALLALLAAACGAHVTVRVPVRVRVGRPTVAPRSSTPSAATPSATADAVAAPTTETPTVAPSLTATHGPPSVATARPSRTAPPTATETPGPLTTVEGTVTAGSTSPEEEAAAAPLTPPATPVNTPPPRLPSTASAHAVRMAQLRFSVQGEFVQIVNRGPDQDLSGWRLVSAGADSAFTFPDGYVLRQGETVTVHSGTDDAPARPGHLQWTTEHMWHNVLEEALLCDAQGVVVDRWPRR